MSNAIDRYGSWNVAGQTQIADTAIVIGIPPYPGKYGNLIYGVDGAAQPLWLKPGAYTHVTQFGYTSGSTLHTPAFMRAFNWTYTTVAAAKNTATLTLKDDPGIYSTNYRYPSPISTGTAAVADNALAASDYVAFQLTDGTWVFDTVASGTYAACVLTTTLPNVTGGGVAKGQAVFWFGVITDKNPGTGAVAPTLNPKVSVYTGFNDAAGDGLAHSQFPGQPLILYDGNATGAGTVSHVGGYYGRY